MKEYVLVLCTRPGATTSPIDVLLILKDRPEWQKGRLNLPGGKIEEGESPLMAARRELKEEAGYDLTNLEKLGTMQDRDLTIHCLYGRVADYHKDPQPREGETEVTFWAPLQEAMEDPRLIPNLRTIIPMLFCGVDGWVITDEANSQYEGAHTFNVTVPTYK